MFLKASKYLLFLTGLTILSCASSKEFPEKYKGDQIHFGQGGGFTGAVKYYILLDDGRLFHLAAMNAPYTYEGHWKNAFVTQMMMSWQTLHLDDIHYNEPGDLFYFLQRREGDGPFHRITWGRPGFVPDPKVVNYYNLLYKSTKPKS